MKNKLFILVGLLLANAPLSVFCAAAGEDSQSQMNQPRGAALLLADKKLRIAVAVNERSYGKCGDRFLRWLNSK